MTILTEGVRTGEFILSEANGKRSRETVNFAANSPSMIPGTPVGKITSTGQWGIYDAEAADGREICAGLMYAPFKTKTTVQKAVIIARDAEVSFERTTGVDSLVQASLAEIGIVVRGPTTPFVAPAPQGPA